ncbi:MAG: hypothetical protein IAF38_07615, partial [Bacteroidia bacterium]|nr:hypothetical protein [Bacteroidia bacterium]
MYKVYFSLLAAFIFSSVTAQQTQTIKKEKLKPSKTIQFDKTKFNSKIKPPSVNSTNGIWVNYASVIDQVWGGGPGMTGPATLSANYLNTDSLLYGDFGGTYGPIWVNHLGDILDLNSDYFTQILGTSWDETTAYSVDSVSIVYAYTRNVSSVDTLIFTFTQENRTGNTI